MSTAGHVTAGPGAGPATGRRRGGLRPLDRRLLRRAGAARAYVVLTAGLGLTTAVLVVLQALLLARVVASVAMGGAGWADVRTDLALLCALLVARSGVSWAQERFGQRAATTVVRELRLTVATHLTELGPVVLEAGRGPALTTLLTRGLDALDGYFVRYVPQLLLAATVTPGLLLVIAVADRVSAVLIAVTIPLVPLFMWLVGRATQAQADRRLRTMQRLGAQVLDLVAGLPTLRALGRERGQARRVREVGEAYRTATMRTLRTAFLSALVLETLTTICVALVAVGIGLRLLYGRIDLQTGLAVLILAPEVYLPLRLVGLHYHASVDGLAAAAEAFAVLDRAPEPAMTPGGVVLAGPPLGVHLRAVGVVHPGRDRATPAALHADLRPGRVTALAGASGAGKSTALEVLLGLRRPTCGAVVVTGPDGVEHDLADLDPAGWWRLVAWEPQRPLLVPGTLAQNVQLAGGAAGRGELAEAARATGLLDVVAALPEGWDTAVGQGGVGLPAAAPGPDPGTAAPGPARRARRTDRPPRRRHRTGGARHHRAAPATGSHDRGGGPPAGPAGPGR